MGSLGAPEPEFSYAELPDGRSVFDLASLTKALVTTPLVFSAFETGALERETGGPRVADWLAAESHQNLPEAVLGLTVRSLLKHESGLPAWRNFWLEWLGVGREGHSRETRICDGIRRASAVLDPRKPQLYSDVGFLLLGLCLERVGGLPLVDQWLHLCRDSMGFDPVALGVNYATRYEGIRGIAVPTSFCALRQRQLCGEVHDENCASLGGETAHAGLFGSGEAVCRYLHAFAGSALGKRVLASNAAERKIPPGEPPPQPCLGWRQGADPSAAGFGDGIAMGHLGFTGTAFWVYPESGQYAVLLTNRVATGRINPAIAQMRRQVFTSFGRRLPGR